jgi:predicted phosphodiesterase
MRYAIISDIHSNLEALEVVLKEIDRIGVDRIVCLGDLVGYNANPNECIQILQDRGVSSLMGNHDAAACGREDPVDFNPIARAAVLWTRKTLEPAHLDLLEGLPEEGSLNGGLRLAHGSLLNRDHYLASQHDIMENIQRMQEAEPEIRVLFFGHTHIQIAYAYDRETLAVLSDSKFPIQDGKLYLINPGSVGQPRDRDPRSGFLVYDGQTRTVEFVRLSYDVHACSEKILTAGLPRALADRLHTGW